MLPKRIIPSLLTYNKVIGEHIALDGHQAIRSLLFCITRPHSTEPAAHNTLISMYAAHPAQNEDHLLCYSNTQAQRREQAISRSLRLCIAHQRVQSAVQIYMIMKQCTHAVDLALKDNETELAAEVTETPSINDALRKNLCSKIAKKIIHQLRRSSKQEANSSESKIHYHSSRTSSFLMTAKKMSALLWRITRDRPMI